MWNSKPPEIQFLNLNSDQSQILHNHMFKYGSCVQKRDSPHNRVESPRVAKTNQKKSDTF